MAWGKSLLLTIPLLLSGILVVASPASAQEFSDTDWKTISAGGAHSCGIDNSGYLYCWGNDDSGQLGNTEAFNSKTTPNRVGDSSSWTTVSAGSAHTCGIRGGGLYCWGNDSHGQLGNTASITANKGLPQRLGTLSDWKTVSAGGTHTCATRGTGSLYCWGNDSDGQIGDGSASTVDKTAPKQIYTQTDWRTVSAGGTHTCATRGTGKLYCWGSNTYGQTVASSDEELFASPQPYPASWRAQDTGERHTCAISGEGQMTCWGNPEPPPDCPAPGTNVYADDPWQDLGYWKLTTPVDANDDGKADEVKQPALTSLDGKDYFDRLSSPTRIRFRADVDGATTTGSSFPRSELREMTQDGQYNRAAWTSKCGTHRMTITQAITHLPETKDEVVAGQIHDLGVDGGTGDVVMIRLEGERLFVEADGDEVGLLDDHYALGERFTATVTAKSSGITVTYDNLDSTASNASVQYNPPVNNEQWFFKAGCYTQSNTDSDAATAYGEVVIYDLEVVHS